LFAKLLPVAPEPTADDRWAASRLEEKIMPACNVLAAGFEDNEIVAAKKIDPDRAATFAELHEL
jgi:hypothetical protein